MGSSTTMQKQGTAGPVDCTMGILKDLEISAEGSPARALIIAFSAIAAAEILFARNGMDRSEYEDLYQQHWLPFVASNSYTLV